jgi:hypothetical protein
VTFFVAWVVFPLVLCGLAFGCGLLLEHVVGYRLPGVLVLPAGFALVIVVASLTTASATTASLTTPLVVALAVAGVGLAFPLRRRPDHWAVGVALAVFFAYAAPIVLSGGATFAGYISLDDTATWLAFADNALVHGRSLVGLEPSSYEAVLRDNLPGGYPIASMVPLGIGNELTGQDAAWLFQPYIAFLGSLLALSAFGVVEPLVDRGSLRAFVVFVGAQPALLYGYAFWSGIKEVTAAYLIALCAALASSDLGRSWRPFAHLPLAVAGAALLVCLSALGGVWLAGLVLFVWLSVSVHGVRQARFSLALALACGLVLALPALASAWLFIRGANRSDAGNGALGNLFHPLSNLQVLGIWPTGDFRGRPAHLNVTYLLLGLLALAAAFGIREAVRRRAWGLPLYVTVALSGWLLVVALHDLGHGSPWLDAKALASASPALLVAGMSGAALLVESGRRVGVAVIAVIAIGVLWSNELAFGDVWLAPRNQLSELETIGSRFAGDGPALMTEYQPYGVRHFLRHLDAEGASERRTRPVTLRAGGVLDKSQYADLDAFDLDAVLVYRTLVLRTSPLESRPPSAYVPVWSGRFYEVWQRPLRIGSIDHLSLGSADNPVGVPSCQAVLRLGTVAADAGGSLVAAERPRPGVLDLAGSARPSGWQAGPGGTVLPDGAGSATETISVPRAGRYGFWLGGSFRDEVRLLVDGKPIGSTRDQLEETAQLTPLGSATLSGGTHDVTIRYVAAGWRPGSRGAPFWLGPLVFGLSARATRLVRVPPAEAPSLCGRPFDWIEAVAPSG